ncbi:MAG: DUF2332 domain-containing protein, partial [Microbacterium sp.]
TVVVTTPGVLVHVPRAARAAAIARARAAGRWLTLDEPGIHDGWAPPVPGASNGTCLVAVDGDVVARADPLGRFVEWLPRSASPAR